MRSTTRSTLAAGIALAAIVVVAAPSPVAAQQAAPHTGPEHVHGAHGARGATRPAAKPAAKPAVKPAAQPPARPATTRSERTTPATPSRKAPAPRLPAATIPKPQADSASVHDHHLTARPDTTQLDATGIDTTQRLPPTFGGQPTAHAPTTTVTSPASAPHAMWMRQIGGQWSVMGMAQVFPTLTAGSTRQDRSLLRTAGIYATQPAIMASVASPGARLVLRTTLNFEELTQENGELTFGGWGEGFIDSRHPHTLVHEAMLTANFWDVGGGALSISAGKGFAPYGTDDPMGRPAVKFPTNHHLSQVLERFTANALYIKGGWGIEAGLFGGAEPKDAYDFSNIESFGDSWSARLSKRFGDGFGPTAPWEIAGSYAHVEEAHHGKTAVTKLVNANVRHAQSYDFGTLYTLAEWSRSKPNSGRGHSAILGETQVGLGASRQHQPYARIEYATRPEYERQGAPGTPEFYRYDHDSHEIGATRWLIGTLGYGYSSSALPTSVRPYVELQRNTVRSARGAVDPRALYGSREFWSLSAGARIFIGGGPMRMGSYGALDPMTAPMRPRAGGAPASHDAHGGH